MATVAAACSPQLFSCHVLHALPPLILSPPPQSSPHAVAMLAFISLPLTGSVFAHKPTFLKQRSLRMFPPTAYGASMLAQEVPLMVACAIIFSGGSLTGACICETAASSRLQGWRVQHSWGETCHAMSHSSVPCHAMPHAMSPHAAPCRAFVCGAMPCHLQQATGRCHSNSSSDSRFLPG